MYSFFHMRSKIFWFLKNTFFILFFTGRTFLMVKYIIKLVLELKFLLHNPRKQPIMWILWNTKNHCFWLKMGHFQLKWGLKPSIMMYLDNIHLMHVVPVTLGNFFFQIIEKWPILGSIEKSENGLDIFAQKCSIFSPQNLV